MNRNIVLRKWMSCCFVVVPMALAACATPMAEDVDGRWRPVNRFDEVPQAIPFHQAYVYQASPVDGTLSHMLARWAKDAGLTLAYLHPNDYTLYAPVAQVRTNSLEEAASALSVAYAAQGVRIVVERPRIIVSQATSVAIEATPAAAQAE